VLIMRINAINAVLGKTRQNNFLISVYLVYFL
jgi:hypothetical protein